MADTHIPDTSTTEPQLDLPEWPELSDEASEGAVATDPGDELFDVVDSSNTPVSQATRKQCHEEGLLHRSTHIFLFRTRHDIMSAAPVLEVLLQRRAASRKVGGGLWDVSVAEHLSVGESFPDATVRGAREELGLTLSEDELVQIRAPYLSKQFYPEAGILDHMFTTTFAALYEQHRHGAVLFDKEEVDEVEWWPVHRVVDMGRKKPELCTRWMNIELRNIDLIEVAKMITGEL